VLSIYSNLYAIDSDLISININFSEYTDKIVINKGLRPSCKLIAFDNKTKIIANMQRISRKISNDPVLLFDWIMCILFGLLALGGIVLLFLVSQNQVVMRSTLGLALMSLMYSPLVHKNLLIRIILIIVTIGIAIY
jgi:hypothetical protein